MPDIYDDPEINTGEDEYADQVSFNNVGDSVRGTVLAIDKITTRFGPVLKYTLYTGEREVSMLAGGKNLKAQVLAMKPRVGDVLDVKLIELRDTAMGTAKLYDVRVENGDKQRLAPTPPAGRHPSDPTWQPPANISTEESDLFDR